MKTRPTLRTGLAGLILSVTAGIATPVSAQPKPVGITASMPAAGSAEAAKDYPLATCVISGDKLEAGEMGPILDYVHKEEGKPDRLVRLCCKGCVRDFKKDPAKHLKKIDDAAAAKAKDAKPTASGPHSGHSH